MAERSEGVLGLWIHPVLNLNNITGTLKCFNAFMSMVDIFGASLTTHVLMQGSEMHRNKKISPARRQLARLASQMG